jgi:hypothetical protein
VTVRPSFIALGFYVGWGFGGSALLASGVPLLWGDKSVSSGQFVAGGVLWALFLLPVPFIRCRLTEEGVMVRNYFRSYSFRWDDVSAVELVPAGLLTVDTSWSRYPRFHLRSGEHVDLRAAIHMRKKRAEQLVRFVEGKAEAFGFAAEIEAHALAQ